MSEVVLSDKRKFDFRLVWLKSFLAVVEHGSFSAAAKAMNCNQSTVSRNIQDLEGWLGMDFFDMTVPIKLSEQGMRFKIVAEQVVDTLVSCRTEYAVDKVSMKPRTIKSKTVYRMPNAT